ncbi:MAG TPA: UPF0262 family protein [Ferrovibrio sp.]|uniref:UPF0262 family protein n=1 Tax=Ferrovibrio sp. TaxID=1917215 RepID=UPI002ED19533
MSEKAPPANHRLVGVELDERSVVRRSPDIEHERKVAIFDLLEQNVFSPVGAHEGQGPFQLGLAIEENRLVFDIRAEDDAQLGRIILALSPFRRIVKDYFAICDSYYQAIKRASPSQIETLDMARRGVHNEGSELLRERLKGKIDTDFDTARRLFTLICVLHIR